MIRILVLTSLLIINCYILIAQNETDALRYSSQDLFGSARFVSMSGTFGALGANVSCASYNPAGIGMYQLGELTFTPSIHFNSNKSYFNNSHLSSFKSEIAVGNLGFVLAIPQKNSDWKRINLGIGWNQLSNYNNTIRIEGLNNESLLLLLNHLKTVIIGAHENDHQEFELFLKGLNDQLFRLNNDVSSVGDSAQSIIASGASFERAVRDDIDIFSGSSGMFLTISSSTIISSCHNGM